MFLIHFIFFVFEIDIAYDNKFLSAKPVAYPCKDIQQILLTTNRGL